MPFPHPISILLVDDEPSNIVALEAALAAVDCSLVKAHSGEDALKCVLAQDFAVILLDVRMPGLDGFETAGLIRGRARSHSTPIMFMTAYDPAGAGMQEGYRLGGIDYIYKPFDLHILRSKVSFFVELFGKSVALEQVTADLERREHDVVVLNAKLEERVIERTAALEAANTSLAAEASERLRTEEALRALEHAARDEAELVAGRATVLAEVSRVLVENFMDDRPMLERVAHIAALATNTACVIQLNIEDGDNRSHMPLAVDHADQAVRAELARVLDARHTIADSPWHDLDRVFLSAHPLIDSLTLPLLARTAMIGVLSLGRFGSDANLFTESDRRLCRDLALRVALAVENARLYANARAAIEVRDTFLTVAAHELKTPLTTVLAYSQLLSRQLESEVGQDAVRARRSAHLIEGRAWHLARLIEQIVDVSHLVASRMELYLDDTDLVGMIKGVVASFETRQTSHPFQLYLHQERLQAVVDPVRMKQVMANLIDNAVRYSPGGGPIDITVEHGQDHIVLAVRDRGLGIPDEHRAHIFDRFHQAHAVAHRSGLGLGLHISREIVMLHGGDITVEFPPDGGSQFTVRLPRTDETRVVAEVGHPESGLTDQ